MTVMWRDVKFDEDKAMRRSLEREVQILLEVELLAPKEEPQDVVEQPQFKEKRVDTSTQAE